MKKVDRWDEEGGKMGKKKVERWDEEGGQLGYKKG
jgi:hypothetical protein